MAHQSGSNSPYTIHNLPYGVITTKDNPLKRCAVAFEDSAIDLDQLHREGFFESIPGLTKNIFANGDWNVFAVLPLESRAAFRAHLKSSIQDSRVSQARVSLAEVQCHLPMDTRNFTDFYCSLVHSLNCCEVAGSSIPRNWYTKPSAYNGRTSSLVVSGTPFHRPCGMFSNPQNPKVASFQPEAHMDFELEMGVWLSKPVPWGQRLKISEAKEHIFGLTLLNDWSSRDIQMYEMAPLGPFHGKASATSISAWIVPIEALEAVHCKRQTKQEPVAPTYLTWPDDATETFDIELSAKVLRDGRLYTVTETNLKELHWTPFQQLTHLAASGAGLSPGDVFGTGTVSCHRENEHGEDIGPACLLERQMPRTKLKSIPSDLLDTFLKDGDEVIFEGWCRDPNNGEVLFGFGECRGTVLPAIVDEDIAQI